MTKRAIFPSLIILELRDTQAAITQAIWASLRAASNSHICPAGPNLPFGVVQDHCSGHLDSQIGQTRTALQKSGCLSSGWPLSGLACTVGGMSGSLGAVPDPSHLFGLLLLALVQEQPRCYYLITSLVKLMGNRFRMDKRKNFCTQQTIKLYSSLLVDIVMSTSKDGFKR